MTVILKAGLVNPTLNQFKIVRGYPELDTPEEISHIYPNNNLKPLKLISMLLISSFHNGVLDAINETNVIESKSRYITVYEARGHYHPQALDSISSSTMCAFAANLHTSATADNPTYLWFSRVALLVPMWSSAGRKIFTVLFQSYAATYLYRSRTLSRTLTTLRHIQFVPMTKLVLDVKMHPDEFF